MRFQITDQNIIFSTAPESAVNTPVTASASLTSALINPMMPPLPQLSKNPDQMIGAGNERSTVLRRGWWQPNRLAIGGKLNAEFAATLGMRCLGGTNAATAVTAGQSYDQITPCQTKAQGRLPKLTTVGFLLGSTNINGYDFVFPSCAVANMGIQFTGDQDVTFSAELVNTGYWLRNGALGTPIVAPAVPDYHLMHPAATRCTFSNGSTVDYASEGRLLSGACGLNNNVVVRPMPGDPFITPSDRLSGAYARDIHRGPRDPTASLRVQMDENLAEFTLNQSDTIITSLTYLFRSDIIIGTSSDYYEFEWKYPKAKIMSTNTVDDNGDAAVEMTFYPETDSVTGGWVIQRVRTGVAVMS
jgi:hypothetical protein